MAPGKDVSSPSTGMGFIQSNCPSNITNPSSSENSKFNGVWAGVEDANTAMMIRTIGRRPWTMDWLNKDLGLAGLRRTLDLLSRDECVCLDSKEKEPLLEFENRTLSALMGCASS